MPLLYVLEGLRHPILDTLMSLITRLGEETVFLAVAIAVFWCVDKYEGYFLMGVGLVGSVVNQFLKITCRIPRPWVTDPDFTIVESAREAATGYSFPSGHTQSAVGTFAGLACRRTYWWARLLCLLPVILVPLSRMYLGVHTPLDVGVGFLTAIVLVAILYPLFSRLRANPSRLIWVFLALVAVSVAFLIFMECADFPADIDAANLASARKNAYTLCGSLLGILPVWYIDEHYLHFETRAVWWAQLIKLTVGLALVVGVKAVLKAPLLALCGGHELAHLLRYFAVVLTAGLLWPLTFRFFARWGKKE